MVPDEVNALQIDGGPEVAGFVERAQFEDIVLELVEQCGRFAVAEQVDAAVAEGSAVAVGIVVALSSRLM